MRKERGTGWLYVMGNSRNIEIQRNVMEETVVGMEQKESFLNQVKAKKTTKDSVFRDLFENPTYLLQLYQALHPEDTDITEEQISCVTIQRNYSYL